MDIKILDSWLREFLETKATPPDVAKYLSLSGPSAERIEKFGNDFVYDIEVTTNRIDTASCLWNCTGSCRDFTKIWSKCKTKKKYTSDVYFY